MNRFNNIVLWCISIFILLFALVGFGQGGTLSSLLFLIASVGCNPLFLNQLAKTGKKIPGKLLIPLIAILFIAATAAFPPGITDPEVSKTTQIEETVNETALEVSSIEQVEDDDINTLDKGPAEENAVLTEINTENDIPAEEPEEDKTLDLLEIHFIDVEQGDCTLIKCGEFSMLIDAGDDSKGTAIQNYLTKQGITKLDYLILTHPDADHIGGAPVIITKFDIDKVFVSNYEKDNKTYQKLIQALDNKRLKYSTPEVGSTYNLGSADFTILAPNKTYSDPNNSSVAMILKHGEKTFLFTGDAEKEAEADILLTGIRIDADVYHAGHHGSKSSSTESFLKIVTPEYAVISCAEGNSYGHPNAQTLNTFREMGIKVFRTDEQGSIIAISDGNMITWNSPPTESWKAGEPTQSSTTTQESTTKANEAIPSNTQNSSSSDANQAEVKQPAEESQQNDVTLTYVLNTKTNKFHKPSCRSLPTTNREDTDMGRDEIISKGYEPCKNCNP